MLECIRKSIFAALAAAVLIGPATADGRTTSEHAPDPGTRDVDLAIALDVSGSMSGLIDSAKQRLWDVVNELGRAQPQPRLRVAILSYGDPSYGAASGFVRINQPFTSDLDAVNETLFSFGTNGGEEYVARVVDTSTRKLDWNDNGALKVLFVAGNEAANQDPQISVLSATHAAASRGIVVNTIYCGAEGDGLSAGWRDVAQATNGLFASIDQNAGAVANITTPMDAELLQLNKALNDTYVAFGKDGARYRDNQSAQDANASAMSPAAAASRAVVKASKLYETSSWDLVDAVAAGQKLEELLKDDLPAPMRDMSVAEQEAYIARQSDQREALKTRISDLDAERRDYISKKRAEQAEPGQATLDQAMQEGLRTLAREKGFVFDK